MRQHRNIDAVLSETLGVLGQAEPSEPIRNLLHRQPPTDLTLSVLDRQDSLPYAPRLRPVSTQIGPLPHGRNGCTRRTIAYRLSRAQTEQRVVELGGQSVHQRGRNSRGNGL